ncbi:protein SPEAR1-like [Henckelia pumila]|uniref:protein SPEAR1-like n=1 Tax=Henckelia pumila TaxID=405737 RepID=UPI003C6E2A8B
MGSNYFGSDANGRCVAAGMSSFSSSRKGKKHGSEKPKQPQRGLGVAQLEKIRLHGQMECNYLPTFHNPFAQNFIQEDMGLQTSSSSPSYGFPGSYRAMMGLQDFEGANTTYGESQHNNVARTWQPEGLENHHFGLPNSMTRSFFDPGVEGSTFSRKKKEVGTDLFAAYTNRNSDHQSSNSQDIDLELRL